MFRQLIVLTLFAHAIWALPAPLPHPDAASHIVIVTPQAQVHLETPLKYDAPSTYIHHLSPLARLASPNEETIVYVPAGAAAPIIPFESVAVGGRSTGAQAKPITGAKQLESLQEQIGNAIQMGTEALSPIVSAAEQAGNTAAAAGQSLFPTLFPTNTGAASASSNANKEETLKFTEIETPANTQPLIATEARRFYSIAPVVPHVVDIVHAPVFLSPVGAIRARSIQTNDNAITLPLKLDDKADAKPLKNALKEESEIKAEKKQEFARALDAALAKDSPLQENLNGIASDQTPAATNILPEQLAEIAAEPLAIPAIAA